MKLPIALRKTTLVLAGAAVSIAAVFIYVAMRTGPFAPVQVTVAAVDERALNPALFGTGVVEARRTYRIGPTVAGRLKRVHVEVGELVHAGQLVGEMDEVDLRARMRAQDASVRRAQAAAMAAQAQLRDASAREQRAAVQRARYEKLLATGSVSAEMEETRRQEHDAAVANRAAAEANVDAAGQDLARLAAERDALARQGDHLRLVSPVDGLVTARQADPGTTVVAGQPVVEIVDIGSAWLHVRFDQSSAAGLRAGLPAQVVLRSRPGDALPAKVSRVEPRADSVTEELLAKVSLENGESMPALGELAEVTVSLPQVSPSPVIPNSAVQRIDGRTGVWVVQDGDLTFRPVRLGAGDLDGRVQVLEGLRRDERIVVYSQRALRPASRIHVVESLAGASS